MKGLQILWSGIRGIIVVSLESPKDRGFATLNLSLEYFLVPLLCSEYGSVVTVCQYSVNSVSTFLLRGCGIGV